MRLGPQEHLAVTACETADTQKQFERIVRRLILNTHIIFLHDSEWLDSFESWTFRIEGADWIMVTEESRLPSIDFFRAMSEIDQASSGRDERVS